VNPNGSTASAAISPELGTLFLGWALGILSAPITDSIRRWSVKKRISRAVRTELLSLQDALAVVVIQASRRRGLLTHSLLEALMSTLKTSGHAPDTGKALKLIDDLLYSSGGAPAAAEALETGKARVVPSIKIQGVPFLEAHVHRLDFYPHEIQRQLLEIRAGIHVLNQHAEEAARYHFMTFSERSDAQVLEVLTANFEACCERAAEKASELVSHVAVLLQRRELRSR
jgi:hypothetical protein